MAVDQPVKTTKSDPLGLCEPLPVVCRVEPVYWFTNDPDRVRSDNRRVLIPHTEKHQKLMAQGGDNRVVSYGDGAYRLRGNAFSNVTEGRIPKNVIQRGHRCADTSGASENR